MHLLPRISKNMLFACLPILILALASLACDLEQNLGTLIVGQAYPIGLDAGWELGWTMELEPNKKYELELSPSGDEPSPVYVTVDVTTGILCEGCVQSAEGYMTDVGLKFTFTAPDNGKSRVRIYVREGTNKSTLIVRPIP